MQILSTVFLLLTSLMDADRNIMEQQANDIAQLEEEKALVEQNLRNKKLAKKELQNMKDFL